MNEPESGFTTEDKPAEVQQTSATREGKRGSGAPNIGFVQAISLGFGNYFNFSGRATRAEYWFFTSLLSIIIIGVDFLGADSIKDIQGMTLGLILFATFSAWLSISVRRLHDLNRSGWWLLLHLAVFIGPLVLFVWFCTEGTRGENDYGPPRSETI